MTVPSRSGYPGRGIHGEMVQTIGVRIVSGAYPPGHLLSVEEIEREFRISKTVAREAVKVLIAKGLLDSRPKRGTVVRPRSEWSLLDADLLAWRSHLDLDPAFLHDLTEVRMIVEPEGARLAAERRTPQDLAGMEAAIEEMLAAGVVGPAIVEADLAFHRALLCAAHNELLAQMEAVIEAGLRIRDQFVHGDDSLPGSVPDHVAILEAVRSGDGLVAADATQRLLARSVADAACLLEREFPTGRAGPAAVDR